MSSTEEEYRSVIFLRLLLLMNKKAESGTVFFLKYVDVAILLSLKSSFADKVHAHYQEVRGIMRRSMQSSKGDVQLGPRRWSV